MSSYGSPMKRLSGHSHFVSDVVISTCGQFAVSSSWDKTLRLWYLEKGITTTRFVGHTKDVLSVAFSSDNRQICSSSRDKFSPVNTNPVIVSGGWDKTVKVRYLSSFQLKTNFHGHTGYINSVTVSPDGSLAASGGKDGKAYLWDLGENTNNPLHILDPSEEINTLVFSPNRYWLCAASGPAIKIWDLEHKKLVNDLKPEQPIETEGATPALPLCLSLAWSTDGQTLYAGYDDNKIRVWEMNA